MKELKNIKIMKELKNYVHSLNKAEFAEIAQNWAENYGIELNSLEELFEELQIADYGWPDAQADGLSLEEFIFWWR